MVVTTRDEQRERKKKTLFFPSTTIVACLSNIRVAKTEPGHANDRFVIRVNRPSSICEASVYETSRRLSTYRKKRRVVKE